MNDSPATTPDRFRHRHLPWRASLRARSVTLTALSLATLAAGCGRQTQAPAPAPEPVVEAPEPTPTPSQPPRAPQRVVGNIVDSIFALSNRERIRADLTPLRRNAQLMRAAQVQAEQMAAARKLAHEIPGARYPTMASRLRLVSYTARAAGENIAEGYTSGAALLAGWMTSPTHRANILSPRYTETGIGTARSRAGRTYHAQLFAAPSTASRPAATTPRTAPRTPPRARSTP